jgi:hypothetical protein
MAKIKITIEESGEPVTGLTAEDFESLPFDWTDIVEVEPGVYASLEEG